MTKKQKQFIESCYRLYEQKMYHVAYSILHDEGKAEDAVHDAFLNLIKKNIQFDEPESADCKRFIITVIRNASINIYNKKMRESKLLFFTEKDDHAIAAPESSDNDLSEIEDKLDGLPKKYRKIVRYLVIDEYSTKETASLLGLTEANVRKRYERARRMLSSSLNQ